MTTVQHRCYSRGMQSIPMGISVQGKTYSTKQLFTALGLPLRGRWSERKPKLMGSLVQFGTQCLIVDDAHDRSLLMFLKELTDQGGLQYDHPLRLCLVTARRGNSMSLKEIFYQPDTMWLQFRRRLDKLEPFCRIAGHTSEEAREILAALETVYCERFLDSGVLLVECPDCARTRTLSPHNGVLRFPAHSKRKTRTSHTEQRWAMEKTLWEVVAGERK
jgi:hypothetical protein